VWGHPKGGSAKGTMNCFIAAQDRLDACTIFEDPLSIRKYSPNLMLIGHLVFVFFMNNNFMRFNLR